jgi:membrane associated rhomboid family serine protease
MALPPGRLTGWIVGFTSIVWMLLTLGGAIPYASVIAGFIPARLSGLMIIDGGLPVLLTPLTAALVHADLLHLGFNMLMLFFCGKFVESAIGPRLMLLLYVLGAFAAAFAQYLVDPNSAVPMIGASGAISAIVGSYAVLFSNQKVRAIGPFSPFVVRIAWLAAAWIAIQSLMGLATFGTMTRIAIAAHIGGFLAGLVLARPLLLLRYRSA